MSGKNNRSNFAGAANNKGASLMPMKHLEGFENFVVLYRFMPLSAFEATLDNWSLKATISYEANDPLEVTPKAPFKGGRTQTTTNSPKENLPPFLCFSRKITSPAMWGNYADSGKGVCMVFLFPVAPETASVWMCNVGNEGLSAALEYSRKTGGSLAFFLNAHGRNMTAAVKKVIESSYLLPIRYTQERVMRQADFFKKNQPKNDAERKAVLYAWFSELLSTKALSWSNEEEIRLVCPMQDADEVKGNMVLYRWPMRFLAGVVAGPRCPYTESFLAKKIEYARSKVTDKAPAFFSDAYQNLQGGNVIVTRASYHWKRFELECFPWSNRLEGRRVAWAITKGREEWQGMQEAKIQGLLNGNMLSRNDLQEERNHEQPRIVAGYEGKRTEYTPIKDLKIPES